MRALPRYLAVIGLGAVLAGFGNPVAAQTPAATGPLTAASAAGETPAEEFARICDVFKNSWEPFHGELALRTIDAELARASTDNVRRGELNSQRGWELLKLGDPIAAIAALETAIGLLGNGPNRNQKLILLLKVKMVAHLQAAEDENCIAHHSTGSCILPLRADGVHVIPKQARLAGDTALEVLKLEEPSPQVIWLLNLARIVSGDFPQGVPEFYRLPDGALHSDEASPLWLDRAPALGVAVVDLAGGAIMDDFDGDGLLDLISSTSDPCKSLRAFRNDGQGGFEDVTETWGLNTQFGGLNLIHGDVDNDGALDLLVLRGGWMHAFGRVRNSLLRNDIAGSGGFVDVTVTAGLAYPAYPTQTGAFADYDGDGDLDLYVGNEGDGRTNYPSQLFRNNGDGTFTDVAEAAGVINNRYTKAVTWGDMDNDGDVDLYVSTNNSANRLYRNNGDGTFEDVAEQLSVTRPMHRSFASWFFDFDNDGWLDLFVANFENPAEKVMASYFGPQVPSGAPLIYLNRGGKFEESGEALGLNRPHLPMGANYGDVDNDGWLDVYLGTGEPAFEAQIPNAMYRNKEGRKFADITFSGGFGHIQKGHGVAFGDLDNDGDQDLFHQLGGFYPGDTFGNVLFENPGNDAHWVTLRLVGVKANRFGVGARITIETGSDDGKRQIHRVVGSGGSFGGSSLQQEIGLGEATRIERLTIHWPGSGTVQEFTQLKVDRIYRIVENKAEPEHIELATISLKHDKDMSTQHQH